MRCVRDVDSRDSELRTVATAADVRGRDSALRRVADDVAPSARCCRLVSASAEAGAPESFTHHLRSIHASFTQGQLIGAASAALNAHLCPLSPTRLSHTGSTAAASRALQRQRASAIPPAGQCHPAAGQCHPAAGQCHPAAGQSRAGRLSATRRWRKHRRGLPLAAASAAAVRIPRRGSPTAGDASGAGRGGRGRARRDRRRVVSRQLDHEEHRPQRRRVRAPPALSRLGTRPPLLPCSARTPPFACDRSALRRHQAGLGARVLTDGCSSTHRWVLEDSPMGTRVLTRVRAAGRCEFFKCVDELKCEERIRSLAGTVIATHWQVGARRMYTVRTAPIGARRSACRRRPNVRRRPRGRAGPRPHAGVDARSRRGARARVRWRQLARWGPRRSAAAFCVFAASLPRRSFARAAAAAADGVVAAAFCLRSGGT